MGILQLPTPLPSQVGLSPATKKMVTTDSYAKIIATGYLNAVNLESFPISSHDILEVMYNYNTATKVGTIAYFTPSIVNNVITLVALQQLLTSTVTMNQAAVLGAYATPVQIVAAPGAGFTIVPVQATIYTNFQTSAFAGGGIAILQYNNTVHGAGTNSLAATIPAAEITAAASQIYNLGAATASALTGITNQGVYFSNATGAFTGGSAASTVVITLNYNIVTATV